jgi:hypothetical protein
MHATDLSVRFMCGLLAHVLIPTGARCQLYLTPIPAASEVP